MDGKPVRSDGRKYQVDFERGRDHLRGVLAVERIWTVPLTVANPNRLVSPSSRFKVENESSRGAADGAHLSYKLHWLRTGIVRLRLRRDINARNNPRDFLDFDAIGRSATMVAQPQLGLRTERRPQPGFTHCCHSRASRSHLDFGLIVEEVLKLKR